MCCGMEFQGVGAVAEKITKVTIKRDSSGTQTYFSQQIPSWSVSCSPVLSSSKIFVHVKVQSVILGSVEQKQDSVSSTVHTKLLFLSTFIWLVSKLIYSHKLCGLCYSGWRYSLFQLVSIGPITHTPFLSRLWVLKRSNLSAETA